MSDSRVEWYVPTGHLVLQSRSRRAREPTKSCHVKGNASGVFHAFVRSMRFAVMTAHAPTKSPLAGCLPCDFSLHKRKRHRLCGSPERKIGLLPELCSDISLPKPARRRVRGSQSRRRGHKASSHQRALICLGKHSVRGDPESKPVLRPQPEWARTRGNISS